MRTEKHGSYSRVIIEPGEYFACGDATVISTVLGSCVAACLFDPERRIIGMNHFLLSGRRYGDEHSGTNRDAGRYGIHAMELLIHDLKRKGADRHSLRAKAFGGASLFTGSDNSCHLTGVGEENCRFIREFLAREDIPLDAEDLGGKSGRVIHFSNGDFTVYQRCISRSSGSPSAGRDRRCWHDAILVQEKILPVTGAVI